MLKIIFCVVACATIFFTNSVFAGNNSFSGINLESSDFKRTSLPDIESLRTIIVDEGLDDSKPLVYSVDINGDGIPDYIIESDQVICGTGGCIYLVIDGKTFEKKFDFLGNPPIISDRKFNGHSVILILKYSGPDKATIDVYEFRKKEYERTKSIKLSGEKLNSQLKKFRKAPNN
jgi:hypothetical protein